LTKHEIDLFKLQICSEKENFEKNHGVVEPRSCHDAALSQGGCGGCIATRTMEMADMMMLLLFWKGTFFSYDVSCPKLKKKRKKKKKKNLRTFLELPIKLKQ
jgi:hypothetical protein